MSLLATSSTIPGTSRAQAFCPIDAGGPSCGEGADPGSTPDARKFGRHVGNPIDVITGNKYQAGVDYRAVDGPLAFVRHYNANLVDHDLGLGRGWRHSYHVVLSRVGERLRIVQSDGRAVWFDAEASPSPNPDPNPDAGSGAGATTNPAPAPRHAASTQTDGFLVERDSGHEWHVPDGRRFSFRGSYLVGITDASGAGLTLRYRGRRLDSISDDENRTLRLVYTAGRAGLTRYGDPEQALAGHVDRLELPDGSAVRFRYDEHANLVSAIDDAGAGLRYGYEAEDEGWRSHLTSVTGPDGDVLGRWRYDGFGRVIAWRRGGEDGDEFEVDYLDTGHAHRRGRSVVRYADSRRTTHDWEATPDGTRFVITGRSHDEGDPERRRAAAGRYGGAATETATHRPHGPLAAVSTHQVTLGAPGEASALVIGLEIDRVGNVADATFGGTSLKRLGGRIAERDGDLGGEGGGSAPVCPAGTEGEPLEERLRRIVRTLESLDPDSNAAPFCERDVFALQLLIAMAERELKRSGASGEHGAARYKQQLGDGNCPLPNHVRDCDNLKEARVMAGLSACPYAGTVCSTALTPVSPASIGLTDDQFLVGGRPAMLFYDPVNDRYTLAFRGTEEAGDWIDNAANVAGLNSDQYAEAAQLGQWVDQRIQRLSPDSELTFTGHSLGGGLATVAALRTEHHATVFNPAALDPRTAEWNSTDLDEAGYYIHVFRVDGDAVSEAQRVVQAGQTLFPFGRRTGGVAPGYHSVLPRPEQPWMEGRIGEGGGVPFFRGDDEALLLHGMEAVIESLDGLIEIHC